LLRQSLRDEGAQKRWTNRTDANKMQAKQTSVRGIKSKVEERKKPKRQTVRKFCIQLQTAWRGDGRTGKGGKAGTGKHTKTPKTEGPSTPQQDKRGSKFEKGPTIGRK